MRLDNHCNERSPRADLCMKVFFEEEVRGTDLGVRVVQSVFVSLPEQSSCEPFLLLAILFDPVVGLLGFL